VPQAGGSERKSRLELRAATWVIVIGESGGGRAAIIMAIVAVSGAEEASELVPEVHSGTVKGSEGKPQHLISRTSRGAILRSSEV